VRHRFVAGIAIPAALSVIAVAGCGSNSSGGSGSSGSGKTVVIGMSAPLTGSLSALGLGMKNSVDLAVKQANQANKIPGWTIKFDPQDDQADANVGGQVAARLASENNLVGVVGTLNSSVAQQEQKAYNDQNIVMISPANTNPTLTQGPDFAKGNKTRPYKSYFRVATTDAIQGPFAAKYLYETGAHSVATVNDQVRGNAAGIEELAQRGGGSVVLAPREVTHPAYPDAVVRTPGLVALDASSEEVYTRECFGPVTFLIRTTSTEQSLDRFVETVREHGAMTAAVWSTSEAVLDAARDAAADAGVALSENLTGPVFVNQTAAFSDYHGTGANPAANAAYTDAAFVANRFRVVTSRRHI